MSLVVRRPSRGASTGASLLVLALIASPVARAEDAGADQAAGAQEIVVTAARYEQKSVDVPASISVIGREELEEKRFGSLAEALVDVEGIDVGQSAGKTGGLNISIRGMPSDYTLVLIDGRRQNAPGNVTPNGFGETATSFLPPFPRSTGSRSSAARCPRSMDPTRWAASST